MIFPLKSPLSGCHRRPGHLAGCWTHRSAPYGAGKCCASPTISSCLYTYMNTYIIYICIYIYNMCVYFVFIYILLIHFVCINNLVLIYLQMSFRKMMGSYRNIIAFIAITKCVIFQPAPSRIKVRIMTRKAPIVGPCHLSVICWVHRRIWCSLGWFPCHRMTLWMKTWAIYPQNWATFTSMISMFVLRFYMLHLLGPFYLKRRDTRCNRTVHVKRKGLHAHPAELQRIFNVLGLGIRKNTPQLFHRFLVLPG